MRARSRRKLEMGQRALEFSRAHPDSNPGYETALVRLDEMLNRAAVLTDQQRNGFLEVRIASRRKRELRKAITKGHLTHLMGVAQGAEKAVPGLTQRFRIGLLGTTYLGFRAAARGMLAEVTTRKETLMQFGLSVTVLDALASALDQFDAAVKQGVDGRRNHTGATQDLAAVADEVVQIVRVMDGLNRVRFADDAERLPAWEKASAIFADPAKLPEEGETPPEGGEVRPAA
ncbi:MAG TPA: hypothetical protein VFT04_08935 [Gemmatimonadales bacterium]|nr:hypothetical protein [Gemmatimonadales bacterium]